MPRKSKNNTFGRGAQRKSNISKTTLSQTSWFDQENLNTENKYLTNTHTKGDLVAMNPSRSDMQKNLPVHKRKKFKAAAKATVSNAPLEIAHVRIKQEIIDDSGASTSTSTSAPVVDSIAEEHRELRLQEVIDLWNELCKIPVPRCKCYHKAKAKN